MLESDFEELLEDYMNGSITDKDFLTLVSAAGSNPKWKKKFEDAEKMLEMSSDSFLDREVTRFKNRIRNSIENVKSAMRNAQSAGGILTKSIVFIVIFFLVAFAGIYPQVFLKKITFGMMIVFFQLVSTLVILFIGVYVFFFRGKD